MRNKVKLIATAAVAAGAISLGAAALAGGSSSWPPSPGANPNPGDLFFTGLPQICVGGVAAIREQVPNSNDAAVNFAENCFASTASGV